MIKKDGKEIYTFVGLVNRMDACRDRSPKWGAKDIPEEVEFGGSVYKLNESKTGYFCMQTGMGLAEAVADQYDYDISQYITRHEFVVTPSKRVFLSAEEKEFLRLCNAVLKGGAGIEKIYLSTDTFENILTIQFRDSGKTNIYIPIGQNLFRGIEFETEYTLTDLKVYE